MAQQMRYASRQQERSRERNGDAHADQPAQRNNDVIPVQHIPLPSKAIAILERMTSEFMGPGNQPQSPVTNTPLICAEGHEMCLDHPKQAFLRWGDLTIKEPKTGPINRLLTLACVEHMRAVGLAPPLHYRHATTTCYLDSTSPGLPKMDGYSTSMIPTASRYKMAYLSSSITPVHIIRSPTSLRPIRTEVGHVGYPVIPNTGHSNNCMCQLHIINNNIEAISFVRACVPVGLRQLYDESEMLQCSADQHRSGPKHVNTSFTYFSPISYVGTALPKLILRPSLGNVEREVPQYYEPPFATINLDNNPKIKKALFCQMSRPDLGYFTRRLAETTIADSSDWISRFHPITKYGLNEDVLAYGHSHASLETIVLNSVLVEPFKGPRSCPYCDEEIDLTDSADLLAHITNEHRYLLDTNFTCPACLRITIVNKTTFLTHFRSKHGSTLSLMTVLTESHLHARLQLGFILYMFLNTAAAFNIKFDGIPNGQLHYVSPLGIGGYTSDSPEQLMAELEATQTSLLPGMAQEQAAFINSQPQPLRIRQPQRPPQRSRPYDPADAPTSRRPQPKVPQPRSARDPRRSPVTTYASVTAAPTPRPQPPMPKRTYLSRQMPTYTERALLCEMPSYQEGASRDASPDTFRQPRHPFSASPSPQDAPSINIDGLDQDALLDQDEDLVPPARFHTGRQATPMDQSPSIDDIISMQN